MMEEEGKINVFKQRKEIYPNLFMSMTTQRARPAEKNEIFV